MDSVVSYSPITLDSDTFNRMLEVCSITSSAVSIVVRGKYILFDIELSELVTCRFIAPIKTGQNFSVRFDCPPEIAKLLKGIQGSTITMITVPTGELIFRGSQNQYMEVTVRATITAYNKKKIEGLKEVGDFPYNRYSFITKYFRSMSKTLNDGGVSLCLFNDGMYWIKSQAACKIRLDNLDMKGLIPTSILDTISKCEPKDWKIKCNGSDVIVNDRVHTTLTALSDKYTGGVEDLFEQCKKEEIYKEDFNPDDIEQGLYLIRATTAPTVTVVMYDNGEIGIKCLSDQSTVFYKVYSKPNVSVMCTKGMAELLLILLKGCKVYNVGESKNLLVVNKDNSLQLVLSGASQRVL